MKKHHYAKTTIEVTDRRLKLIAKNANRDNPEEITEYLANIQVKNSYKESLANAYYRYARSNKIEWQKPIIKRSSQPPYVPTTEELTANHFRCGEKIQYDSKRSKRYKNVTYRIGTPEKIVMNMVERNRKD